MPTTCCSFGNAAAAHFSQAIAARDLDDYRRNGPGETTRLLVEGLTAAGAVHGSLLDVGTGVGALMFELLDAGFTRATAIDLSPAYVQSASQEAARRGRSQVVRFVQDDVVAVARHLPPETVVTLDRVICCYPDYVRLLRESLRLAERAVGISYPRDRWYVRVLNLFDNAKRRMKGSPFRTFIHNTAAVESQIVEAGFTRISRQSTWTWRVDVYGRGTR